jgi:hypothetical protein
MKTELKATRGSSYFGSGGYDAGWKVLDGEVEATPIAGSEYDNGFVRTVDFLIRPKTPVATIRVWDGDCISNSGHRSLGAEGNITLIRDETVAVPSTCPHCGHILPS